MGILSSLAGGIIGNIEAGGDQDKDTAAREAALQGILGVNVPTIDQQTLNLDKEAVQGTLNPNMEGTVTQGSSAMGGISTDPRLRDAQLSALASLQQRGQGGLTSTDRMNLMNITNQTEGDANAASKAIEANMAARGMGGGGAELAARLAAAQGAANRGAQNGMNVASQAQQQALQAMLSSGQLGTQIQGQDFAQKAQQAQAQDAISRFNAANQQQVIGSNTQSQNAAQQYNLANKQNVANTNVGLSNQQQVYNKGLYQQQYNNQINKAKTAAGQYNQNAGYYGDQANATRGMWSGIGNSVNSMLSGGDLKNMMGGSPSTAGSGASTPVSSMGTDFSGVGGTAGTAAAGAGEADSLGSLAMLA